MKVFLWIFATICVQLTASFPDATGLTGNGRYVERPDDVMKRTEPDDSEHGCKYLATKGRLGVLPGVGWDNLVNAERGPLINLERFRRCVLSSDGKFLIPDDVILEPYKASDLELTSDVYDSTSEYKSITAFSINSAVDAGTSFFHMNGDFSVEKESLRKKSSATRGLLVRSQVRHHRYTVYLVPDSTLHSRFRNRLLDIAAHLIRGNVSDHLIEKFDQNEIDADSRSELDTEDVIAFEEALRAFYLADLIVRDFGTHGITSVDIGGTLVKTDTLKADSVKFKEKERTRLAVSASAAFGKLIKAQTGMEYSTDESEVSKYHSEVAHSRIQSYGGPIFHAQDMNLYDWERGLEDQLVAIDRSGVPISELITSRSLPELEEDLVVRLSKTIAAAVKRYYTSNAVIGCMDPTSVYFDDDANVAATECTGNDSKLKLPSKLPLGGVFQMCRGPGELCDNLVLKNPATGDLTCPQGYMPVRLLPSQMRTCLNQCEKGFRNSRSKCHQECATTDLWWCSLDPSLPDWNVVDEDVGFIFGGLYTDKEVNPVTHQYSCPEYSQSFAIGKHMRICLSSDRELGSRYSFPFGGFYSCRFGNPLATVLAENFTSHAVRKALGTLMTTSTSKNPRARGALTNLETIAGLDDYSDLFSTAWPHRCPKGYAVHLVGVEDTCQVNYCVPANILKGKRRRVLKRPPFIMPPILYREYDDSGKQKNLLEVPDTMPAANKERLERLHGDWVRSADYAIPNRRTQLRNLQQVNIALICLLTVTITVLVIIVSWLVLERYRRRPRHPL